MIRDAFFGSLLLEIARQRRHLGIDEVGRARRDRLLALEHACLQVLVDGNRCRAVLAPEDRLGFLGDVLVALAEQHVEHGLRADDLRGRRDQRNVAEVFSHARNLFEHLVEAVGGALVAQLVLHVGQHPARHLGHENSCVDAAQAAFELRVFLAHGAKIIGNLVEQLQIEAGLSLSALQNCDDGLRRRMAVGHAHRGDGRVEHVDAGFRSLDVRDRAHARRRMRLHRDRDAAGLLEPRDELECDIGLQEARHVLDADRVTAHVLELLAHVDPEVERMHGAHGIRHRALRMLAAPDRRLDRRLEIAKVIECIEDAEDVHAVLGRLLDERLDDVVGVVPVAEQVLPSEQHLLRRVRHLFLELTQPLPGVLAEIANAGVEGRAAPALHRPVTDLVELRQHRQHVLEPEPRRQQ